MERKRNDWSLRLQQELKVSKYYSYFVTLTYDDMHLPMCEDDMGNIYSFTLCKNDLKVFIKSLRNKFDYELRKRGIDVRLFSFRYFAVGEYGGKTLRPHYHLQLFNFCLDIDSAKQLLEGLWPNGFVQIGLLHDGGCHYQAKYMIKPSGLPVDAEKPFMLCSKSIGLSFLTPQMIKYLKSNDCTTYKGVALPRYYRDKVWSTTLEKELLSEKLRLRYMDYINKLMDNFKDDNFFRNRSALMSLREQKFFKELNKRKV